MAAYASYDHQELFARTHGADGVAAAVWPLSVDGLVVLACVALLDPAVGRARPWLRLVVRAAFVAGVGMSMLANIAAGTTAGAGGRWDWAGVAVSGWPPVALLLAVEILMHSLTRDVPAETNATAETTPGETETAPNGPVALVSVDGPPVAAGRARGDSARVMWAHYQAARAAGRTPTGAELDRIAGTRDYGRAVLARWRRTGRIPADAPAVTATVPVDDETTTSDVSSLVDVRSAEGGGDSQAAA
ncbi:Protein of unknown function [Actinokineospora iranica]|uniref:DUF2637 domain-containing protein n=1 Tax=Actinokineospora iranica TaxID=1271860 RepID=A0A1G6JP50_9PSEU|nr:Protein of unknown function [Actinokineospora iranica]